MSFWPGKGLYVNRHKRAQRVRVVWRPPGKADITINNGASQTEQQQQQANQDSPVSEATDSTKLKSDNREISPSCDANGQKAVTKDSKPGRLRKRRRNTKNASDPSGNLTDQVGVNGNHENGGKNNGKFDGVKDSASEKINNVTTVKRRSRRKRSDPELEKSEDLIVAVESPQQEKQNGDELREIIEENGDDDDWGSVRDGIGPMTSCSSSSSLSSSCSNHSLIRHYTNVMMNCCDNHFKEDCDNVRNKIERILKAHWKDRLSRFKKSLNSNPDASPPNSQPPKESSQGKPFSFEIRPARLPLNKETWSKLRRSNQNSDWLLNDET